MKNNNDLFSITLVACLLCLITAGCRGPQTSAVVTSPDPITSPDAITNEISVASAPAIKGTPIRVVKTGELYFFEPEVFAPASSRLIFTASNLPDWLSFQPSTGIMSGVPSNRDIGLYAGIAIAVSDETYTNQLELFEIEVIAARDSSVTLSWDVPTENEDGTFLHDLAGFKIRYGFFAGDYPNLIDVDNPGVSAYTIENLLSGTYFFIIAAYRKDGALSDFSSPARIVVN